MLKIKMLGDFAFVLNGNDISSKLSNKTAVLLALLFSRNEKKVGRSELASYLWPDSTEEAARYNLRYNLWHLRKIMDIYGGSEPFVIVNKNSCQINPDYLYESDFETVLNSRLNEIKELDQVEELREAARGTFLEGVFFDDCEEVSEFIMMQRFYLEQKRTVILNRLIAEYFSRREYEKCIHVINEAEDIDPYNEENAICKIKALMELGCAVEAASFYKQFTFRLLNDTSLDPAPELAAIGKKAGLEHNYRCPEKAKIAGIPEIEYYGLAVMLKALIADNNIDIDNFITPEEKKELAYVQRLLGECCLYTPSAARIADCIFNLIERLSKSKYNICFEINQESMDRISEAVFLQLSQRYPENSDSISFLIV